jgi:hypothetical protein
MRTRSILGRTARAMGAVGAALVLALSVAPAPAHAAPVVSDCVGPTLLTPLGGIRMCHQIIDSRAQAGYYSTIRHTFGPLTGPLPIHGPRPAEFTAVADDGIVGDVVLGIVLLTGYGPASWGMQFNASHSQARFGSFNGVTLRFYATSGFFPRAAT